MDQTVPASSQHTAHHEHRSVSGGTARAAVFGVSDGLVSNISLIIGFAGSGVAASVVRLAGLAGLVGGAFSMAAGEYVSVAAQNELIERELAVERRELRRNPEAETAELSRMYIAKGVDGERAREFAADIMRDPDTALGVHAREELGIDPDDLASPLRTAVASFLAFVVGAIVPLVPWFVASGRAAAITSVLIGALAAAVVGTLIGRLSERHVTRAALRQVAFLLLACTATYGVGAALGVTVT
ncbi:MAG: VIT1/CCC1 transporter family protein [Acidimicrobiia bacterium]